VSREQIEKDGRGVKEQTHAYVQAEALQRKEIVVVSAKVQMWTNIALSVMCSPH